jgi:hypothetical protein
VNYSFACALMYAETVSGCEAFAKTDALDTVYGITTDYTACVFLQCRERAIEKDVSCLNLESGGVGPERILLQASLVKFTQ